MWFLHLIHLFPHVILANDYPQKQFWHSSFIFTYDSYKRFIYFKMIKFWHTIHLFWHMILTNDSFLFTRNFYARFIYLHLRFCHNKWFFHTWFLHQIHLQNIQMWFLNKMNLFSKYDFDTWLIYIHMPFLHKSFWYMILTHDWFIFKCLYISHMVSQMWYIWHE